MPVCVEACPVRALDSGSFDELKEQYGSVRETENFKYSKRTDPAVVFKPKLK
jgi:anaerobic dimethyl sulfoxide reductase subunit B (iron-sulfur subunit)